MTDPVQQIRALRARSNEAIAARDAERVVSFMADDVEVRVAGGPILRGRRESAAAFAEQFADPAFRVYVRTPQHVTVDQPVAGDASWSTAAGSAVRSVVPTAVRVTERGEWMGRWRIASGLHEQRGNYTAEWRLGPIGWQIASETYTSAISAK